MTSCDLPRIQISDPGELIETVPYLLGFHPRESLVLIGFAGAAESGGAGGVSGTQQIQVTIRLDLPDLLPGSLDAQTLQPLGEVLRRAESAAMAAVLVTDSVPGDPRRSGVLLACRDVVAVAMNEAGIEVLDVLVATERRWWSLCCEQAGCCPSEGHERVLGCSAAAAQATFAGLVALPDRQAMVASLAGTSEQQRSALLPRLAEAERRRSAALAEQAADRRRAELVDLLAAAADYAAAGERAAGSGAAEVPDGGEPGVPEFTAPTAPRGEQLAEYAVALTDLKVRDALWLVLDDGCAPIGRLMGDLHARLPAPYDAAPLFLFGWAQWRAGNSTLAMMAAERVLQSQPGYTAAALLLAAAQLGVDPRSVPPLNDRRPGEGGNRMRAGTG
jgi:Domain of unknown function (DUF4192)